MTAIINKNVFLSPIRKAYETENVKKSDFYCADNQNYTP